MSTPKVDASKAYDEIKNSLSNLYSIVQAATPSSRPVVEHFTIPVVEHFTIPGPVPDWDQVKKDQEKAMIDRPDDPVLKTIKKYSLDPKELYNVMMNFDLDPASLNKDDRALRIKYLNTLKQMITDNYGLFATGLAEASSRDTEECTESTKGGRTCVSRSNPFKPMLVFASLNLNNAKDLVFRIIKLLINEAQAVDSGTGSSASSSTSATTCPVCKEATSCPICQTCKTCDVCQDVNIYIGVIVGLVLLVLILIVLYFMKGPSYPRPY
jgi:hypothetical protein